MRTLKKFLIQPMSIPKSKLERKNAIRALVSQFLDLDLSDQEIETLIEGNPLSIEQLFQNHSLSKLGTSLIRLDSLITLSRGNQESSGCPDGWHPVPPPPAEKIFCLPDVLRLPIEFRLHPDWLE